MHLEVRRDDLRTHRLVDRAASEPADGELRIQVERCALTANNITYAAFGELMGYWKFFPASDTEWGRVPVWGYGTVTASTVEIAVGERIYGYFPIGDELLVRPGRVTDGGFVDTAEHRAALPPVYNRYTRVADPTSEADEQLHAVLRPLFSTSFLIDDWLASEDLFGATRVVIASASSKTALALAHALSTNRDVEVIGLTSAGNVAFVEQTGYYDRTVPYDEIDSLDPTVPTVYVDMGGDRRVTTSVHERLGEVLQHSCVVGATHWEALGGGPLPGPRPALFFAPDHVTRRIEQWGSEGFERRLGAAWDVFVGDAARWLTISVHCGSEAVVAAYLDVLEGRVPPSVAYVIEFDPA